MKPLTRGQSAAALLAIQLVLIVSILAKYRYERATCPRLWVRSAQHDPNQPLRGRYLALNLLVDACNLPHNRANMTETPSYSVDGKRINLASPNGYWTWNVSLHDVDGHLTPRLEDKPGSPEDAHHLTLYTDHPCDRVAFGEQVEYFIPENAQTPFPLKKGEELWVEVTLPPAGPPRPIQLALSCSTGFHPLDFHKPPCE